MEIKYGDIKYFTLLRLSDKLKNIDFNMLGLMSYDKLRNEVDMRIEQINYQENHKNDCSNCDGTGLIDNSYATCDSCSGTGKRPTTPASANKP